MGHCKHQWHDGTEVLREVFREGERRFHQFYVCRRCLKIDEVLAPPARIERPVPPLVAVPSAGEAAA